MAVWFFESRGSLLYLAACGRDYTSLVAEWFGALFCQPIISGMLECSLILENSSDLAGIVFLILRCFSCKEWNVS